MEDKENKTEEATSKRLSDARKKGQVAKGEDLSAAVSFVVFGSMITVLGQFILKNSLSFMNNSMRFNPKLNLTASNVGTMLINSIIQFGFLLFPFALIAVTIGVIVNLVQVGFLFTTTPLKPDFKRLNPIEGFKNIVSKKAMFKLVKNNLEFLGKKETSLSSNVTKLFVTPDNIVWAGLSSDTVLAIKDDKILQKIPLSDLTDGAVCKSLACNQPGILWVGPD